MTDDTARLRGRRLVLRADATTAGGTGHMMRTLALAQAWIDAGGQARWLVADAPSSLRDRIGAEGIEIVPVLAPAGSSGDAAAVVETLTRDGESMAVIDDMAGGADYPVGLLLNQNAHAERTEYPAASSTRFLLGTRYALLRREFAVAPPPRTTPSVARHVLVTFGGADPTGMTLKTIAAIRRLPEGLRGSIRVRFIVGAANADGARIESAAADPDLGFRAEVERAVSDMPAQMAWADLAITSGGSTVWELARTGCPALVVETVPVERRLVSGLVTVGLFGHLGPGAELTERTMADEIAAKAEDGAWRAEMTTLGMRLIDGQGARRVVDALADTSRSREEPT